MAESPGGKTVGKVNIKVVPDTSNFAKELKAQLKEKLAGFEIKVPVDLDSSGAMFEAATVKRALNEELGDIDVDVDLDTAKATAQAAAFEKALKAAMASVGKAKQHNIKSNFENLAGAVKLQRSIASFNAQLEKTHKSAEDAADGIIHVIKRKTELDRTARRNKLKNLTKGFLNLGNGIFTAIPRMLAFGGASLKMSRTMAIVIGVIALLPAILGAISTVLAGLPSLLLAAGAGFAAIKLGMNGIKKAYNKTLKPVVNDLKKSLSAQWVEKLTPLFNRLANKVMPVVAKGLSSVVDGLSQMAEGFTDVITSSQGLDELQDIFKGIGRFFKDLRPMVEFGTQAFLKLGKAGSQMFGYLTGPLNAFARKFNELIQRVTKNGVLEHAMQGLSAVLNSSLNLVNKLFGTGLKAMGILGGPLSRALDTLSGPLNRVILAIANGLAKWLPKAADAFGKLLDAVTPLIGPFSDILLVIFSALADIFKALKPDIKRLAKLFETLAVTIGPMIVPILRPLVAVFKALVNGGIDVLLNMLPALIRLLGGAGATMALLAPVALTVAAAIEALAGVVIFLIDIITGNVDQAWNDMRSLIEGAGNTMRTAVKTDWGSMARDIMRSSNDAAGYTKIAIDQMRTKYAELNRGVAGTAVDIHGHLAGMANDTKKQMKKMGDSMTHQAKRGGDTLYQGIHSGVKRTKHETGSLPPTIKHQFDFSLYNSGSSVMGSFKNGMQSRSSGVVGFVRGFVSVIRGLFPFSPAKWGPFSGHGYTTYSGRALIDGFREGMEASAPSAVAAVRGIASDISSGLQLDGVRDGRQLADDWAKGVKKNSSGLNRAISSLAGSTEFSAAIGADTFGIQGAVADGVFDALDGARMTVDGNGVAKLVNKTNTRNSRR